MQFLCRLFVFITFAIALFNTPTSLHATTPSCFSQTGYCVDNALQSFWQRNGGVAVFGYPIQAASTQMIDGIPVFAQYFERARLEISYDANGKQNIQLGRIGAELYGKVDYQGASSTSDCLFFAQTNQSVCGAFRNQYIRFGIESNSKRGFQIDESIALFGLPISAPQPVVLADGAYTTQWFERARFLQKSDASASASIALIGVDRLAQSTPPSTTAESTITVLSFSGSGTAVSAPFKLPSGEVNLTISPKSDATIQLIDARGRVHTLFNAVTLLNTTPSIYNDTSGDWYLNVQNTTRDWAVTLTSPPTNQALAFQFGGVGTVDSDVFAFDKTQFGLYSVHHSGTGYFVTYQSL
ncbi:MAG: hypothetical protein LW717_17720 [Chloroflexaceae bacterium]|nr:hypothetical protein [Chloroflexaceae bacterium]